MPKGLQTKDMSSRAYFESLKPVTKRVASCQNSKAAEFSFSYLLANH